MTDVLMVGGGTAGHVLPAVASARALGRLRPDLTVALVGRPDSLEQRLVERAGLPFLPLPAVPLPRRPSVDLLRVAPRLRRAVRSARELLDAEGVGVVASFGGYVALPLTLAARGRVPVLLHEQNSRPGLANRWAARFADRVVLTFPSSAEAMRVGRHGRVSVTGNPVDEELHDLGTLERRTLARERLGLAVATTTLLVFGGSQGARSINRTVAAAAPRWRALGLQVLHVTGPQGYEQALADWREAGLDPDEGTGVLVVPFLDGMVDAYAAADVVVARAGATTIAELSVVGLPAVLVPYPHATARHQHHNAEALARVGAATVLDDDALTVGALGAAVADIVTDPARAAGMALAARTWGRPEAADGVAAAIVELWERRHA